jgi:hypothetical protein
MRAAKPHRRHGRLCALDPGVFAKLPPMPLSLAELGEEWRKYPLGRRRAAGGLNALGGFEYQLAVSLEQFIDRVRANDTGAELAFETLSDVASRRAACTSSRKSRPP